MDDSSVFADSMLLVIRLGAATLLGGVLGLERELRAKPAGLRTHMLVSLGAAAFTLAAFDLVDGSPALAQGQLTVDPMRVVEGIIGGIGFLGAGAIIRNQGSIEGLTTAGGIWLTGAVGVAAGAGDYVLAVLTVVLATTVTAVVGRLERRLPVPRKDEGSTPQGSS